jgi:hypothetical protein
MDNIKEVVTNQNLVESEIYHRGSLAYVSQF